MNRHLFAAAFALGALGIIWAGAGFIDSSLLALAMTMLIGAVYGYGALELKRFRQATSSLVSALNAIPGDLEDIGAWLGKLPPSLQNPVRLRIEGERVGLPGPALTPYLVGLLVMLGMLGTFLGMVVTLKGAVFALEKTTDLQAIRSALAVPVKGLGLAFGTSVAGVIASAMLGLMSALSRRERGQAAQLLDTRIATVLRRFSFAHQRQETFKALQQQSHALPAVVDTLQTMMTRMEDMSWQLNQRLLANQEDFHGNAKAAYTELARSVDQSLRDSLHQSAHAAGESIRPVVEAAMNDIAREATAMHARMADTVQAQLDGLTARFGAAADNAAATWTAAQRGQEQASAAAVADLRRALTEFNLAFEQRSGALVATLGEQYAGLHAGQAQRDEQRRQAWTQSLHETAAAITGELREAGTQMLSRQQQAADILARTSREIADQAQAGARDTLAETTRLIAGAEELMRSRIASEAQWLEQHRERMDQIAALLRTELGALKEAEAARGNAAVERLGDLQSAVAAHLATLGTALEQPIAGLIETASQAPRAAAEVIAQLRQEISNGIARDNALLEERSRIMETLNALLDAINHASQEQRAVIDSLVANSSTALQATAGAFTENVAAETARLSEMAAHVTSSAADVASLSDAFGFAVQSFNEANDKLIANLERIEAAMEKSQSRGDEQLAYYVAQAREIIDLSMSSQKEFVESLRRLPAQQAGFAEEAR
ncbi:protein of unknown function [Noviherbaspirillum humi]|uniref:DUF802 domain-containing protein n=1 Tax=Noviherbaspirillum humi TaxID=1688639 RepID=A0A239M0B5_9BURK|nr:DUF802 domain-containing protein [Noviherbaspirillum humi]SNT35503.1 protein of unknown function [Noviherbaspirillum humi]